MTELFKATEQKPPIALMLLGKGGTGKSSIAAVLTEHLLERGYNAKLIRFDELRKQLSPTGADPFSEDQEVKTHCAAARLPCARGQCRAIQLNIG